MQTSLQQQYHSPLVSSARRNKKFVFDYGMKMEKKKHYIVLRCHFLFHSLSSLKMNREYFPGNDDVERYFKKKCGETNGNATSKMQNAVKTLKL